MSRIGPAYRHMNDRSRLMTVDPLDAKLIHEL